MSLEAKIEVLTAAVVALTAALQNQQGATAVVPQVVPQAPPTNPMLNAVAPGTMTAPYPGVPVLDQTAAPVNQTAAAMPAAPSFMPPAAPTLAPRPFNDPKGLIEYVTAAYTALGAEKGAGIGNILGQLGVGNVNDVQPTQYDTLYAGIEALKTA